MIVIGLTGSLGMGKSTTAKMFAQLGLPVLSADRVVHDLMKKGGKAEAKLARLFPASLHGGRINRQKLFALISMDPEGLGKLEQTLHPLVRGAVRTFIKEKKKEKQRAIVLEIPLLFEAGFQDLCDVSLCVFCSFQEQKDRVLQRPGMSEEKFRFLRRRQWPVNRKKALSDFTINTGLGLTSTQKCVKALVDKICGDKGQKK